MKNNKICVYTCITGDYDVLREVLIKEDNVDYICFTNNEKIKSNTWKIIYIIDDILDNYLLSRKLKILGNRYIDANYDINIWIDASIIFSKNVNEFLGKYCDFSRYTFITFKHYCRDSIKEEMKACIKLGKEKKESIDRLCDFYIKENFDDDLGLCEMTMIIRTKKTPKINDTMNLWFSMIQNYCRRDQLSFMYCIFKTNLMVQRIDLNVWENEWLEFMPHKKVLVHS